MTVGWGGGGPDGATEVIGLGLYRNAFSYGKFGYATAMGVVLFFLTLTLAALTLRMSRRERIEF
jgi:N-acetylglucosamine transport system permease protein